VSETISNGHMTQISEQTLVVGALTLRVVVAIVQPSLNFSFSVGCIRNRYGRVSFLMQGKHARLSVGLNVWLELLIIARLRVFSRRKRYQRADRVDIVSTVLDFRGSK